MTKLSDLDFEKKVVETERLAFRPFNLADLPELIEQRSDPDVNRFLGGPARQNPDALSKRIRFYMKCFEEHGFSICPMIWKATGEVIGTAGLQPLENTSDIEVGYSIVKRYWGLGIGTEAARGWLAHGFNEAGLDRIVAVAVSENTASRRIMEKLGMSYQKNEIHYDDDCAFYSITKDDFFENLARSRCNLNT